MKLLETRLKQLTETFETTKKIQLSSDQESKVDTIYQSMSKLDSVSAQLPTIVDRLKELRSIHESAVECNDQVRLINTSQIELKGVLASNQQALSLVCFIYCLETHVNSWNRIWQTI